MAESMREELAGHLQGIASAVGAIDEFSDRLTLLLSNLDTDRSVAREQLNEMKSAVKHVQDVLVAVSAIHPIVDRFTDEAQAAGEIISSSSQRMSETARDVQNAFAENSEIFKSEVSALRAEIRHEQEVLKQEIIQVPQLINEVVEPTVSSLVVAAQNLGDVSELVRGRLENLSSEINLQILNRISPEIENLNRTLLTARNAVSSVPDMAAAKIEAVHARGIAGIDKVLVGHDQQLAKMRESTQQLEDVLNRSDDFIRMASSLERNVQLMVTLQQGLDEKRPSITKRLDVAVTGSILSFGVGVWFLDFDPLRVGAMLIPAALVALNAEPILSKIAKSFRNN